MYDGWGMLSSGRSGSDDPTASFPAGLRCDLHGGCGPSCPGPRAARVGRTAAWCGARVLLLRSRLPVQLPGRRARRAALRARRMAARSGRRRHRGDPWADPLRAAAAHTAAERRAAELRVPLVWPEGSGATPGASLPAMRVASFAAEHGRAAAFALAGGGCSGAAASSSTIPRSWPRPPRPPGWAWRTRCTRAVTRGATAPWRPSRAACWPPAPTGCRPWLPGGRLFAGELQLDEAAAAARSHPRSAAGGIPA
jgi:hypothetical protein